MPGKESAPAVAATEAPVSSAPAASSSKTPRPRVARPDFDAQKKEIDEVNLRIEELKKKFNEVNEKINGTGNIKSSYDKRRDEIRAQLDTLNAEKTKLQEERTKILDQIKALQASVRKRNDEINNSRDKHGFRTVEEVDKQISVLEKQLEGGNIKLIEEKRIVNDISVLKKTKKTMESLSGHQSQTDADRQSIEALREKLKEFDPQVNRKALDEARAALAEINQSQKSEMGGFNELISAKKAAKAELDAEFDKLRELRKEQKRQRDEFRVYQDQEYQRQREQQKLRRREELNERFEREAARNVEDADYPAFTDEINTTTALIDFLKGLSSKPTSVPGTPSTSSTSAAGRAVDSKLPEGAMVLKKKDDREEDYLVMGSPKRKGKKGTAAAGEAAGGKRPLRLDLGMIQQLNDLKVDIPSTHADVERTITDLEAKKKHFQENQATQTALNKKNAEKKLAELRAKMAKEMGIEDGDNAASEEKTEKNGAAAVATKEDAKDEE